MRASIHGAVEEKVRREFYIALDEIDTSPSARHGHGHGHGEAKEDKHEPDKDGARFICDC